MLAVKYFIIKMVQIPGVKEEITTNRPWRMGVAEGRAREGSSAGLLRAQVPESRVGRRPEPDRRQTSTCAEENEFRGKVL
jgi:hypothetical protein